MSTYFSEIKSILQIALPLMGAFLAQKGMQLIDTVMMGWIGPEALAAGILSTTIFMLLVFFCMGTLSAVGIHIARARGAGQMNIIPKVLMHGVYLVILLSVPCMILIWITPNLLFYFGNDQAIVEKC
ncbi:MAG TPA: MATE family efflux transporter, partial [Gammaproteobacteria bacterium]|nr:MATE family efflux transporter [Gammaproteobacteria bacterium]